MLQIDVDKAFDRVKHNVLSGVLHRINVYEIILEGAKIAYKNCTTKLIANKKLTRPIYVWTSVKQGYPTSPLLFNMYLDLFCLSLVNSKQWQKLRLESA